MAQNANPKTASGGPHASAERNGQQRGGDGNRDECGITVGVDKGTASKVVGIHVMHPERHQ